MMCKVKRPKMRTEKDRERERRYWEKIKSDPEKLEKYRKRRRELYRIHMEDAEMHEKIKARGRNKYKRMTLDPDRHAVHCTRRQEYYYSKRDKILAQVKEWKSRHKKRIRQQRRFAADKLKVLFRQCPELYAIHRAQNRIRRRQYYDRTHNRVHAYSPRISMRIPDTCHYGKVLDKRSVFLWNNLPAASLVAGRAYRTMQWRETHCDRFGESCR